MSGSGPEDSIEVCACGFDLAQCGHKQEVGGCRQDDDDADPLEAEDDGDALASAGFGTDEDYRHDDLSHDDGSSNPLNEDGGWRDD
jgi:hypothetical protein